MAVLLDPKGGLGGSLLMPTLPALWRAPEVLPKLLIPAEASKSVLKGADLDWENVYRSVPAPDGASVLPPLPATRSSPFVSSATLPPSLLGSCLLAPQKLLLPALPSPSCTTTATACGRRPAARSPTKASQRGSASLCRRRS